MQTHKDRREIHSKKEESDRRRFTAMLIFYWNMIFDRQNNGQKNRINSKETEKRIHHSLE
jgi:hypothetical protein